MHNMFGNLAHGMTENGNGNGNEDGDGNGKQKLHRTNQSHVWQSVSGAPHMICAGPL